MKTIKLKAGNISPHTLIGEKASNHPSATHSPEHGGKTAPLAAATRIGSNISQLVLRDPTDPLPGTFQRIDPKIKLIEKLEWKLVKPSLFRPVALIAIWIILVFLYLGFKLKKELGLTFFSKSGHTTNTPRVSNVKRLALPKDPGAAGFHDAALLVQTKAGINHHGNTPRERMAAASLRASLELVMKIKLKERGRKQDSVSIITCCHDGSDAAVFLVNVVGINQDPENESLRPSLAEYAWNAVINCREEIDSLGNKKIMLALQREGKFEQYLIGDGWKDESPDLIPEKDATPLFQKQFVSWLNAEKR